MKDATAARDLLSRNWIDTYQAVASKAALVREILDRRGINLGNGSALSQLLRQADILNADWLENRVSDTNILCEAAHVNRLADSIMLLPDEPGIQEALKRMAHSVMQPGARSLSQGKDALWEITLLADLRKTGMPARAAEPDIMVALGMVDYPIACKKIWSEANVAGQIKKGTRQLAKFEKKGIIALNLDDLTPPGRVIYERNGTAAKRFLTEFNMSFVERHRYTLQRPVKEGKCDGFIISTTAAAVLAEEEQPFNLVTQTSLWHIKESTPGARERFMAFGRAYAQ